jgi:hypothetical protein
MWRCIVRWESSDVSKEARAFIFIGSVFQEKRFFGIVLHRRPEFLQRCSENLSSCVSYIWYSYTCCHYNRYKYIGITICQKQYTQRAERWTANPAATEACPRCLWCILAHGTSHFACYYNTRTLLNFPLLWCNIKDERAFGRNEENYILPI